MSKQNSYVLQQVIKNITAILFWAIILALSVYFFLTNVFVYVYGFRSKTFGSTFFSNQVWVVLHLIGGTLALLLGPLQFWKSLRVNYLSFHRTSGKLYSIGALMVGLSALRLALISSCRPCRVSLFLLALLLLFTTLSAWYTIKHKNVKAHQAFMIRSYITVFSFVAVRIDDVFSLSFLFGSIDNPTFNRTVNEYFFSFVPLLIAEIFLTWLPALQQKKTRH